MILRHASYICDPRNINIEINFPVNSRHIIILLQVDNIIAKKSAYVMLDYPTKIEEYNNIVKRFCSGFINCTEDELYQIADKYMPALYAHRNLKKVLHRSGKIIWERP